MIAVFEASKLSGPSPRTVIARRPPRARPDVDHPVGRSDDGGSCSTTTTLLPLSRSFRSMDVRWAMSRAWRPMLGSSRT